MNSAESEPSSDSALEPTRASVTEVASSSVMVTVWVAMLPSLAWDPAVRPTVNDSASSSAVSLVMATVMVLLVSAAGNTRSAAAIAVKSLPPVAEPSIVL